MIGSHTLGSGIALGFAWAFLVVLVGAESMPPAQVAQPVSRFVYMAGACALLSIASRKG